jgi:hypothetical protein
MNTPELESILKKARTPEISGESLEMFPRLIAARLKRNEPAVHAARNFSPRLAWAFGLAACAVIAFAIGHWSGRMETGTIPATDSLASLKLIRETAAMFPNRVRAIVQDERGLNLVLSDTDDVPVSPALYVHICDGQHCSSFVTFSGQEIQVAGQKLTVLADARGGIILEGNHLLWSSTEPIYAGNHLKIEAKNLGAIAM